LARGGKKTPGTPAGYGAQPVKTTSSDTYGDGAQSARSQGAVPLPDMTQLPQPGGLGPLNTPSVRPQEPISTGADFGPGPTTGELPLPQPQATDGLDAETLKVYLPALEALASSERSSHELRSFVRRLRAQAPTTLEY
jgi:hypothetical protein